MITPKKKKTKIYHRIRTHSTEAIPQNVAHVSNTHSIRNKLLPLNWTNCCQFIFSKVFLISLWLSGCGKWFSKPVILSDACMFYFSGRACHSNSLESFPYWNYNNHIKIQLYFVPFSPFRNKMKKMRVIAYWLYACKWVEEKKKKSIYHIENFYSYLQCIQVF